MGRNCAAVLTGCVALLIGALSTGCVTTSAAPSALVPSDAHTSVAGSVPPQPATSRQRATRFGINVGSVRELALAEQRIGARAPVVGIFADFAHTPNFPSADAAKLRRRGSTLLVSWEPWDSWKGTTSQPDYRLATFLTGRHDKQIDRWAQQIRAVKSPVMLRFAPEQNGNWRPWAVGVDGNTAAQYRATWRYVVDRFRRNGATNVIWVWNPIVDVGATTPMSATFPGQDVVHYTAVDGYNWGSTRTWGWQSYDDIFATSVRTLKRLAPQRPWMIAEVGCAPGQQKPAWISSMFSRAATDGAWAVVWFEFTKETDWRLGATPTTAAATRSALEAAHMFTLP